MLSAEHRLRTDKDFSRVHTRGRIMRGPHLALRLAPNTLKVSRFGFLVGKKVSKSSVARKKALRRLREATRASLPLLRGGYDVVVLVRPSVLKQPYANLKMELASLFQRSGLLKRSQPSS